MVDKTTSQHLSNIRTLVLASQTPEARALGDLAAMMLVELDLSLSTPDIDSIIEELEENKPYLDKLNRACRRLPPGSRELLQAWGKSRLATYSTCKKLLEEAAARATACDCACSCSRDPVTVVEAGDVPKPEVVASDDKPP